MTSASVQDAITPLYLYIADNCLLKILQLQAALLCGNTKQVHEHNEYLSRYGRNEVLKDVPSCQTCFLLIEVSD